MKKPNIDNFRKVCNAKSGIISNIAYAFGVDRTTVYDWCEKYPQYKEALNNSREVFLDVAESNLQTLVKGIPNYREEDGKKIFEGWIEKPSESAIIFVLRTIGKKRGYTEKQEVEMNANLTGSISIDEWIKDRIK
jgi:NADH:ubiquinone oxidoreductase subunit E